MAAALDELDKTHGESENYLAGAADMTAQTLAALKDALLCRSPTSRARRSTSSYQ
jgi:hypothetical protein